MCSVVYLLSVNKNMCEVICKGLYTHADMAELADALDLKSNDYHNREGSNPFIRIMQGIHAYGFQRIA